VALGVVQFRVDASHVVRLEITMVDAKNEPCTIAHACCHAGCSALACSSLRGRSGGPAKHAAQPEAPSSTFYGHPSYSHRTKRTITRAITWTDGAAPRPSERLVARGTTSQIWDRPQQKWGGPPQTGRARTQRYTAPRHPAYARASSGDQWQSVAIRCNQWQSSSDQWPSLAIPMQSVAISGPRRTCARLLASDGNQWPSVAISGPRCTCARLTASSPSYQCRPRPPASTRM
jgi:hypothetical protein